MIQSYMESKGVDFQKFTEWAFGKENPNPYLEDVPSIFNQLHPDSPIYGYQLIRESLDQMIQLYKVENDD